MYIKLYIQAKDFSLYGHAFFLKLIWIELNFGVSREKSQFLGVYNIYICDLAEIVYIFLSQLSYA
jgi:hypothetical protein